MKRKIDTYSLLIFIIYLGAIVITFIKARVEYSLDPSWMFSLNYSSTHNFSFGDDIIFTYGPLGFVGYNIIAGLSIPLIIISLIVKAIYGMYVFFLLLDLFNKVKNNHSKDISFVFKYVLFPWLVFEVGAYGEYTMLFFICLVHCAFLSCVNLQDSHLSKFFSGKKYLLYSFTGFTAALMFFIKISFLPFVLFVPFVIMVHLLLKKRYNYLIAFLAAFVVTFLIVFISFKVNYAAYFTNSIEIIVGYKKAMQIYTWDDYDKDIFISIIFIGLFFVRLLYVKKREFFKSNFFLIALIVLCAYFLYTYSFTRGTTGGLIFHYPFLVFIILFGLYLHEEFGIYAKLNNMIVAILFFSFLSFIYADGKKFIFPKHYFYRSMIPIQYLNKAESYDAYPFLSSVCYFNNLNYKPRPVIQAYSSYTTKLDKIDSAFFSQKKVDNIIFNGGVSNDVRGNSIDGKYFMFEEPITKMTILKNYQISHQINDSLFIAAKREHSLPVKLNFLKKIKLHIDQPYTLDQDSSKVYLFTANIKYSTKAKIISFIRKYPHLKVHLTLSTGEKIVFNAAPEFLKSPCILNKYCNNYNDYFNLFGPGLSSLKNVKSMKISANRSAHDFISEFEFNVFELNGGGKRGAN